MAAQGYTIAYGIILERGRRKDAVAGALIHDLKEALFRPSVDAELAASNSFPHAMIWIQSRVRFW